MLEDLDELLYHVDRMLHEPEAGRLVQGARRPGGRRHDARCTTRNEQDPFGQTAEEIITDAVGWADYPVCFGFPVGHIPDNRALVMGQKAKLSVTADRCYAELRVVRCRRLSSARTC